MNTRKILTVLCGCCLTLATQAQQAMYELIWEDNFNETTFDTCCWSKIPRGSADWNRHMSDDDRLYEVKDGNLVLHGIHNNGVVPQDTARYLTGGLYTKGKVNVKYGKVEICARLGCAQGAWPAIWMLPEEAQWPNGGEIDIMEHLNHDTIAYQTVHSYYTHVLKHKQNPPHGGIGPIDRDGYNVYAVEILPDSLVFSINGRKTFSYPRIETDEKGQYPFGTPFYLLVDMQIEGSWVGRAKPEELPVEMWVDWVKMYNLKEEQIGE